MFSSILRRRCRLCVDIMEIMPCGIKAAGGTMLPYNVGTGSKVLQ